MSRTRNTQTETPDGSTDRTTHGRRSVLRAAGLGAAVPVLGGTVAGRPTGADSQRGPDGGDSGQPPLIHPQFGYSGTSDDDVPKRLTPDETVGLHVDEERIDDSELPELTVEFGAFHFAPVGLHVEPGAVVEFDFESPEHTATAYHPGQERQRRVPDAVPPFSSTVNEHGGFWLYRFEEEGVYDLFCAPHEWAGMGMRIVVGDDPGAVVRGPGRPPLPMTAALLGTGLPPEDPALGPPEMAPERIVEEGSVALEDLSIALETTLSAPTPVE